MKRFIPLMALAVVLFMVPRAGAQTELRFKFKAGDKLAYTTEQKGAVKTDFGGKQTDSTSNLTVDWTIDVVSVADGKAVLTYKIDRLRSAYDFSGVKTTVDTDDEKTIKSDDDKAAFKSLKEKGVKLTINTLGQVDKFELPPEMLAQIKKDEGSLPIDELVRQMFTPVLVVFPKEGVKKGQNWKSKPAEAMIGVSKIKMEIAFTYDGTVERDARPLEKIAVKVSSLLEKDEKADKVEITGDGMVLFDNAAGRIAETTLTVTSKMRIDAGGGVTGTMTTQETRTMKPRAR
jgi:hypothetical protein